MRFKLENTASVEVVNTKEGTKWVRKPYKTSIHPIGPVAIKLGQREVHAPEHDTWGIVSCDGCKERFAIGPNRVYVSRTTELECVAELEELLRQDHLHSRPHQDSYELRG
jgi:hypothetical protein